MTTSHPGSSSAARRHLVSQRLRARRQTLGLTQEQVAARLTRLGLPTSNRVLSGFERGGGLDVARLPELAVALECSVTYLLGLTVQPRRWQPDQSPPAADAARTAVEQPSPSVPVGKGPARILGPDVPDRLHPTPARA